MSYETTLDIQDVLRIFPPQAISGGLQLRNRVLDEVLGVWDRIGWRRLANLEFEALSTPGSTVNVVSPNVVPYNVVRVVLWGFLDHTDAASHDLAWGFFYTAPDGTGHTMLLSQEWKAATGAKPIGMPDKTMVLPPGATLIGIAEPAIGVGFNFAMKTIFVDLPFGEYLHL